MELEEDIARELLAFRGEPWPEQNAGEGELHSERPPRICRVM